jgi:hypothetical protein
VHSVTGGPPSDVVLLDDELHAEIETARSNPKRDPKPCERI